MTKRTEQSCLTGKTLVQTKEGPKAIKDLVGKTISITNGTEWFECSSFELKNKSNVIRITFEDGTYVDSTKGLNWRVVNEDSYTDLTTEDLSPNMLLDGNEGDMRVVKVKDQKVDVDVFSPSTEFFYLLSNGVLVK